MLLIIDTTTLDGHDAAVFADYFTRLAELDVMPEPSRDERERILLTEPRQLLRDLQEPQQDAS